MLVPKPYDMAQFVNDNPKLVAIIPNRYCLRTISTLPNERAAATRADSEDDVIFLSGAFNECDAGVILPMSHCLNVKSCVFVSFLCNIRLAERSQVL
jgi:hypothetical protein